jgi:hypothetical protein
MSPGGNNHREVGVFITTYWTRLRWYEKTGYGLAAFGVVLAALLRTIVGLHPPVRDNADE